MDMVSIIRLIWRHKIAVIPVILLTLMGLFYVFVVKPPVYQASATVLLVNPPGEPTTAQISANPQLKNINANNPYVNYNNLNVVADVVMSLVTAEPGQQALVRAGADPRYQVALSSAFGTPPIIQVTGVASSGEEAIRSAALVASAIRTNLHQMQAKQDVNSYYMITSEEIVQPTQAHMAVSGKIRTLIAVLGLSALLLLVAVSMSEAIEKRRKQKIVATPSAGGHLQELRTRDFQHRRAREIRPR